VTSLFTPDQARGCLLGLAVGDALGAPFEFHLAPVERAEMRGGGIWAPGEWTDDTTMALMLGESLLERREFDMHDIARRYIAWAQSGPKDIGGITSAALINAACAEQAIVNAKGLHERTGLTAGNGTIMRAAPLALPPYSVDDVDRAVFCAKEDARLTHYDPAAGSASAALCAALMAVAQGEDPVPAAWAQVAGDQRLERVVELANAAELDAIGRIAATEGATCWATLGVALAAHQCFPVYRVGVQWAVSLGGDTDTNAAVSGALLGCQYGAESIPEEWLEPLFERERIERVALGLADARII
jgi:ADP-ribosyl-[dinitrogen reductase] hydrolase